MSEPITIAVADKPLLDSQDSASPSSGKGCAEADPPRHISPCPHRRLSDSGPRVSAIVDSLLICGDARRALRLLPSDSIQTVVTSPPYWSLRDYQVPDQTGRNDSLSSYIRRLVGAFDELRRVLRADGTVWLNVGDSSTSGNSHFQAHRSGLDPGHSHAYGSKGSHA